MKRVLVLGCPGAGKSTLSRQLGSLLGLEVIHLDGLYWKPGWVETPDCEWTRAIADVVKRDSWIIDGNYLKTLSPRLQAADTVVFFDLPRRLCLQRIIRRWLRYRGTTRPDIAAGCVEKIDWEFIKWVWRFPADHRPAIIEHLRQALPGKRLFTLRTPNEVSRFVRRIALRER